MNGRGAKNVWSLYVGGGGAKHFRITEGVQKSFN